MPSDSKTLRKHLGSVIIFPTEHPRLHVEEGHLAAEAIERLGELRADGAAADDGQPWRQYRLFKDGLIGQVADLGQTRNRNHGRARTGGD